VRSSPDSTGPTAWNRKVLSTVPRRNRFVRDGQRHRKGQEGLLLLVIDPDRVGPEIRYEEAKNGEAYPHIYGPLNIVAKKEPSGLGDGLTQ